MDTAQLGLDVGRTNEYWSQTRRPLACLVFLLPLLLAYELGVVWLGGPQPDAIRNGADFWMRDWLMQAGLGHALLLPGLVVGVLLAWHYVARHRWRVSWETLLGMLSESLLFAFLLIVLGQLGDLLFRTAGLPPAGVGADEAARAVTYLGAGVYEEVLFRLCLLPACYGLFRLSRLPATSAAVLAILATSLLFSLAHHIGPDGESLRLFPFAFRVLAGVFFAVLFVLRGFGIAVGCHAAYDLLVGVVLADR